RRGPHLDPADRHMNRRLRRWRRLRRCRARRAARGRVNYYGWLWHDRRPRRRRGRRIGRYLQPHGRRFERRSDRMRLDRSSWRYGRWFGLRALRHGLLGHSRRGRLVSPPGLAALGGGLDGGWLYLPSERWLDRGALRRGRDLREGVSGGRLRGRRGRRQRGGGGPHLRLYDDLRRPAAGRQGAPGPVARGRAARPGEAPAATPG